MFRHVALVVSVAMLAGCSVEVADDEISVGDIVDNSDQAAGSDWGSALTPKVSTVPAELAELSNPKIVVSLNGLTLHLTDDSVGFDKVYPVGVGQIENGKSLTPTSDRASGGTFKTGSNTREVSVKPADSTEKDWGYYYPHRYWANVDGVKKPVFAGLPFIRVATSGYTAYGMHGPVDNFRSATGGDLRRGYVSHGCMRMAAGDIQEVYHLIHKHPSTPLKIQQAVERKSSGLSVDLASRWVGSECAADSDCNFAGGTCRRAAGETIGVCTAACTRGCADRVGEAETFCVPDPSSGAGMCVPKATVTFNNDCARHEGKLVKRAGVARPDRSATASVCMPAK
jgi:lipoprotein-anchoring transpeptidase ErfK/SrfK